ncbi:MAG TPA: Mut7-C RNAse domain-containing protein [Armatimonadota bacterium]|nr:Mut7-C RNAse domain-containing protein [Armatimonadota bacterium]
MSIVFAGKIAGEGNALTGECGAAGEPRFFADSNVGRLARWLRILGFDVSYDAAIADAELVRQALAEDRIILTRDTGVVQRRAARRCLFLHGNDTAAQLLQVLADCGLHPDPARFWSRCPADNTPLQPASKEEVRARVPPHTFRTHDQFFQCPRCRRVYWHGSHQERFQRLLQQSLSGEKDDDRQRRSDG